MTRFWFSPNPADFKNNKDWCLAMAKDCERRANNSLGAARKEQFYERRYYSGVYGLIFFYIEYMKQKKHFLELAKR